MNHDKTPTGHLAAFITILIWGTTFISTKVLLKTFSPVEILFIRFVMGYLALWLVCPRTLKLDSRRQEPLFMAAGLCGITMYYLLENIALTFTLASNVGVIISIAPFFTAILSCLFLGGTRPGRQFFIGFLLAMAGIFLLSFGSSSLSINPMGDILAVAAAIIWAVYSTLTKKISALGYSTIQTTRRTFFYGLIFMIPALALMDFNVSLSQVTSPLNLCNLLFLGLGASALCFVTWNLAVKILGSVRTSVYIYMVPVITTVSSALVLKEPVTMTAVCGIALTLAGLFLSERPSMHQRPDRAGTVH
ncbi:DMT family transporter [Lachnoclostridium pacaense]|uniref:DMT family transporter n=1 Tax=Enterocloster hominis (ex Hitch et al. 2024) TaxID=1917870 RepID=UPI001D1020B5|nr:DMT family transporter [Lachnoclostridium pacaense]MCC2879892.1 DMT family transporter [Lachnoclostridium pacaense]